MWQRCKKANALVNSFIEHKKLTLSSSKCHKTHYGNKNNFRPKLKVHMEDMHEAIEEKYLGDQVNKNAQHASTISKRRAKGFGIISDIIQIIDIIPDMKKSLVCECYVGRYGSMAQCSSKRHECICYFRSLSCQENCLCP